jgi:hypothetical protein
VIGAGFGWMPQLYTTQVGGLNPALGGWNGAFRLGLEVPGTQPFVLRPSLEYRIGVLPGLELPCADSGADTGETQWTCSPGSPVQELFVYTSGLTHKVGGGTVFANLPAEGQAEGPDGPLAFEVTGARSVMMGTWRAQVVGSYAF